MKNFWIFDLDNTIYDPNCGMFDYLNNRINFFMVEKLNIDYNNVNKLRRNYFKEYGSTMIGLIRNHNIDADEFLTSIHGIDVSIFLQRNNEFVDFFKQIPGNKIIITNSPLFYAENVLTVLGLEKSFDEIYDIKYMDYLGKPHLESLNKIMSRHKINGCDVLFVDDTIENIILAKYLSYKTLFVDKDNMEYKDDYYLEFLIPNLKRFL